MTTEPRTLNAAEIKLLVAADTALAQALFQSQQAQRNAAAAKAQQVLVYEALGLDPNLRYEVDRESGAVKEIEK
jgi:hypothetical protein